MKRTRWKWLSLCFVLGGCVTETAGHEQQLDLVVEGNLPKIVSTASVVIASAELYPCNWAQQPPGRPSVLARLSEWLVPTAHAHSESSALRIGAPRVIELHAGDGTRVSLGRFFAPEGRYCDVSLELGPADEDANGADGGLLDTLQVSFDDERESLFSAGRRTLNVALRAPLVVEGPPKQQTVTLAVDLGRWPIADGLDAEQALSVLTRTFLAR